MTERNPLWTQISELEQPIINFHNGLESLGQAIQNAVDANPQMDISALYFVEIGLRAVRDDLKTQYFALHTAAGGTS